METLRVDITAIENVLKRFVRINPDGTFELKPEAAVTYNLVKGALQECTNSILDGWQKVVYRVMWELQMSQSSLNFQSLLCFTANMLAGELVLPVLDRRGFEIKTGDTVLCGRLCLSEVIKISHKSIKLNKDRQVYRRYREDAPKVISYVTPMDVLLYKDPV